MKKTEFNSLTNRFYKLAKYVETLNRKQRDYNYSAVLEIEPFNDLDTFNKVKLFRYHIKSGTSTSLYINFCEPLKDIIKKQWDLDVNI